MDRARPTAVVFDMDGVLLNSAPVHARAWKETFDEFLAERGDPDPFVLPDDYRRYVDGRPRYEGVATFLSSRGVDLPPGEPTDPPGMTSVTALGNLKNRTFHRLLETEIIEPLPGVEDLLDSLHEDDTPTAIVSSSRNTHRILPKEIAEKVDLVLGGEDLDALQVPGKPAPDLFVRAAERLGVPPLSSAVVEDSPAGVRAGRRGGFSLVVGVDPDSESSSVADLADIVVTGVFELHGHLDSWLELLLPPPPALENLETIQRRIGGRLEDDPSSLYVGDDESELLLVRKRDGVGVLIDPDPPVLTWADFSLGTQESAGELRSRLGEGEKPRAE